MDTDKDGKGGGGVVLTAEEFRRLLSDGSLRVGKKGRIIEVHGDGKPEVVDGKVMPKGFFIDYGQTELKGIEVIERSGNRRVVGAKKTVMGDGVVADSKLEAYMRQLLVDADIDFDYQGKVIIQPACVYYGRKIRPITWYPDFFLSKYNMFVDTKGYTTEVARLKIKMFKFCYDSSPLVLIRTRLEAESFVQVLQAGTIEQLLAFME